MTTKTYKDLGEYWLCEDCNSKTLSYDDSSNDEMDVDESHETLPSQTTPNLILAPARLNVQTINNQVDWDTSLYNAENTQTRLRGAGYTEESNVNDLADMISFLENSHDLTTNTQNIFGLNIVNVMDKPST